MLFTDRVFVYKIFTQEKGITKRVMPFSNYLITLLI